MKKLLLLLAITLTMGFISKAQETPPTPGTNFKQLTTSQFWISLPDSTLWQFKGSTYGWSRIAKLKDIPTYTYSEGVQKTGNNIALGDYTSYVVIGNPSDPNKPSLQLLNAGDGVAGLLTKQGGVSIGSGIATLGIKNTSNQYQGLYLGLTGNPEFRNAINSKPLFYNNSSYRPNMSTNEAIPDVGKVKEIVHDSISSLSSTAVLLNAPIPQIGYISIDQALNVTNGDYNSYYDASGAGINNNTLGKGISFSSGNESFNSSITLRGNTPLGSSKQIIMRAPDMQDIGASNFVVIVPQKNELDTMAMKSDLSDKVSKSVADTINATKTFNGLNIFTYPDLPSTAKGYFVGNEITLLDQAHNEVSDMNNKKLFINGYNNDVDSIRGQVDLTVNKLKFTLAKFGGGSDTTALQFDAGGYTSLGVPNKSFIFLANNDFESSASLTSVVSEDGTKYNSIGTSKSTIALTSSNGLDDSSILIDTLKMQVRDAINHKGLEYYLVDRGNWTSTSLIDKFYADSLKATISLADVTAVGNSTTGAINVNGILSLNGSVFGTNYSSGEFNAIYSGTSAAGFLKQDGSSWLLHVLNTGNVGIGTTTPSDKLEVNGTVKAKGYKSAYRTVTADYTITGDDHTILCNTSSNNIEITVPDPSTVDGMIFYIKQKGSAHSVTINFDTYLGDGNTSIGLNDDNEVFVIQATGSTYQVLSQFKPIVP